MSLSAKRESLAQIHGRYQRAGRRHKTRILDEFCGHLRVSSQKRAAAAAPAAAAAQLPGAPRTQAGL